MIQALVVNWGNSRGIRIPKPLLEQAGILDDVTLEVREGEIVIRPSASHPRAGWAESIDQMVASGDAGLVWPDDMVDDFEKDHRW